MFRLIKTIFFNKYIFLLFLPLFIGWFLLGNRLQSRTDFAMYSQRDSVTQIWGGNLEQPMPSVRYKGFGSDVAALSAGDIHASDIKVDLVVDYRKKGLVYYTGYNAHFNSIYTMINTDNEKIYLSFIFPYPMKQGQGILQDVKLLVNGEDDPGGTEYQHNLILWTGLLGPSESLKMNVQYMARGLNNYIYGFEPGKHINNFKMKINVKGAVNVDYPVSTMTPTKIEYSQNAISLIWERNSSQSQLNIGVTLPDKINIARQCEIMVDRAPVFYLLFFFSVWTLLKLSKLTLNFIQIANVSAAYFLFYPFLAYLSMYIPVVLSFVISFSIMGFLIWKYTLVLYNMQVANAILTAYTFYLGITSVAALLPTYTGIILVIEGVVLIGIIMHVLAKHRDISLADLFDIPNVNNKSEGEKS